MHFLKKKTLNKLPHPASHALPLYHTEDRHGGPHNKTGWNTSINDLFQRKGKRSHDVHRAMCVLHLLSDGHGASLASAALLASSCRTSRLATGKALSEDTTYVRRESKHGRTVPGKRATEHANPMRILEEVQCRFMLEHVCWWCANASCVLVSAAVCAFLRA